MKQSILLLLLAVVCVTSFAQTRNEPEQPAKPTTIAIFPFKNLHNEDRHDGLIWGFADSLHTYLSGQEPSGKLYSLVLMDDVRDQMLALNVDPKSPSYETDVWEVAQALGAEKIVWGTYFVKYEKANLEAHVIDVKTLMRDRQHFAEKVRVPFPDALATVNVVGDKILPALK